MYLFIINILKNLALPGLKNSLSKASTYFEILQKLLRLSTKSSFCINYEQRSSFKYDVSFLNRENILWVKLCQMQIFISS